MSLHNQTVSPVSACVAGGAVSARAGAPAPGAGASLGIYAGNPSPPPSVDPETGEVRDAPRDHRTSRAERFILKGAAGRLLPKDSRTSKCMRWTVPNRTRDVVYSPKRERASYQGLQVCASPWVCPVCSAKISERRREEVAQAIAGAKASGLVVFLLTLTFPHGLGDDLGGIVAHALKAYSKLFSGKAGAKLRDRIGLDGTIRAIEVTHGLANGFHPHFHVLLFLDPAKSVTPAYVHAQIAPRWQAVCVSTGLPCPSIDYGCRVDGGDKAAAYVAKGSTWGLESEVTKGQSKVAKGAKGRTPFALLRDYAEGDKQAGAFFVQYAQVFQGKRQLVWSNGLKRRMAVVDRSDDELANLADDLPTVRLATITDEQWKVIYRRHWESVVLDVAERSPDQLHQFLDLLGGPT